MIGIYTADIRLWGRGDLSTLGDPDRGLPTDGCSPCEKRQRRRKQEAGGQRQGEAVVPGGQSPPSLGCGDMVRTRPAEDAPQRGLRPPGGRAPPVRTRPGEDAPRPVRTPPPVRTRPSREDAAPWTRPRENPAPVRTCPRECGQAGRRGASSSSRSPFLSPAILCLRLTPALSSEVASLKSAPWSLDWRSDVHLSPAAAGELLPTVPGLVPAFFPLSTNNHPGLPHSVPSVH